MERREEGAKEKDKIEEKVVERERGDGDGRVRGRE